MLEQPSEPSEDDQDQRSTGIDNQLHCRQKLGIHQNIQSTHTQQSKQKPHRRANNVFGYHNNQASTDGHHGKQIEQY